jgi:Lrp/AsnC family transcriptional regulator
MLRAAVPDIAGYDRLYKRLIAKVPLTDVSAFFVMEKVKETTALPLDFAE